MAGGRTGAWHHCFGGSCLCSGFSCAMCSFCLYFLKLNVKFVIPAPLETPRRSSDSSLQVCCCFSWNPKSNLLFFPPCIKAAVAVQRLPKDLAQLPFKAVGTRVRSDARVQEEAATAARRPAEPGLTSAQLPARNSVSVLDHPC